MKLCNFLGIPIPRIHCWSAEASSNPVCTAYIIEKKASGQQLGNLWYKWPKDAQFDFVRQLVDIETRLASVSFQEHGSIYYRSDLESKGIACKPFSSSICHHETLSMSICDRGDMKLKLQDFAIGPLTDPRLWEGERATMSLDRGPCTFLIYKYGLVCKSFPPPINHDLHQGLPFTSTSKPSEKKNSSGQSPTQSRA